MKTACVLTLFLVSFVSGGCASAIVLARDGKSDAVIVQSAQPTEAEAFAARELAEFLKRSTGAALPIVREADFKGDKAIYVGQTEFAGRQKIDFTALGPEEWAICAVNGNLVIAGGRPRGTLYGAYEFLEKVVGVRFLDAYTDFVPEKPDLIIPAGLTIRDKPAFFRRDIFMVESSGVAWQKFELFLVRRKINTVDGWQKMPAHLGFSLRFGSPYSIHTLQSYTADFPADKPEYFALTENGSRTGPGPDGQVCMSHPEVRKLLAAKLREYIKRDREEIVKAGAGEPFRILYSLAPNDNTNKCVCENCMSRAKKYGAYTGVVLEFINSIADDIAQDYPEILIETLVYTFYMDIPQGIRPHDNVVIRVAQLGSEFDCLPKRDALRSMTHPINAKSRKVLEDWAKISRTLGVHDYWTAWKQLYQWPQANIHGLAQTLKLYHRCGMSHFFVEDELYGSRLHNFVDLQFYMASKLLQDPNQDEEAIIAEFMELYYGKAAPSMTKLLNYIERRQEEEPGMLATVPPAARKYFDTTFFTEADAMISKAEKAVADDPKRLSNIRQERLAFDETMLYLWESLNEAQPLPFKREEILKRLQQNYETAYAKYGPWGAEPKKDDAARLEYLRNIPPTPPQFVGKKIIDLCEPQLEFRQFGSSFAKVVADPDAAVGKAWRLDASIEGAAGKHDEPPKFGLYDSTSKELVEQIIPKERVPKDEKYHFYLAGRMKGSLNMYFWAHHSRGLNQRLRASSYNSALPEPKTYDVYASIKFEGPAYVPGSAKENSFSIDRVILVEVTK